MKATTVLPPKAERFTCHDCGLIAPRPIVVPMPNPTHAMHGRCSNRQACAGRLRRTTNTAKQEKKRHV